jgi:hypothetical protein
LLDTGRGERLEDRLCPPDPVMAIALQCLDQRIVLGTGLETCRIVRRPQ